MPRLLPGFSPGPAHAGHRRTNTELVWYATTQVAAQCAAPQDFGNRCMRRAVHVRQDLRRLGAHNPNTQLPHNDALLPQWSQEVSADGNARYRQPTPELGSSKARARTRQSLAAPGRAGRRANPNAGNARVATLPVFCFNTLRLAPEKRPTWDHCRRPGLTRIFFFCPHAKSALGHAARLQSVVWVGSEGAFRIAAAMLPRTGAYRDAHSFNASRPAGASVAARVEALEPRNFVSNISTLFVH